MYNQKTTNICIFLFLAEKHAEYFACELQSSCITLVTGYFATGKSKHDFLEYKIWFVNFLSQVEAPIVIFTQPSQAPHLQQLRGNKSTHYIIFDEIWDLPWLNEPHFLYKDYHKIHELDPEKLIHSPELYAIWNSKPWMLNTASELNPFNSTFFYWMDIGCVRNEGMKKELQHFPSLKKAIQVFGRDER